MTCVAYIVTLGQFEGFLDVVCASELDENIFVFMKSPIKGGPQPLSIKFLLKIITGSKKNVKIKIISKVSFISKVLLNYKRVNLYLPRHTYVKYQWIWRILSRTVQTFPDSSIPTNQRLQNLINNKGNLFLSSVLHYYSSYTLNDQDSLENNDFSSLIVPCFTADVLSTYFGNLCPQPHSLVILGKYFPSVIFRDLILDHVFKLTAEMQGISKIIYVPHPRESKILPSKYDILIDEFYADYTHIDFQPQVIISCGSSAISLFQKNNFSNRIFIESREASIAARGSSRSDIIADTYICI